MSNQYRAVHPSYVAIHGSDVFEAEYTPDEERDWVDRRFLELVPRPYRVLSDNYTIDGQPVPQGAVVELALPVEVEASLLGGGHLERVRLNAKPTVEVDPVTGELADSADVHPAEKKPARQRATTSKEK